MADFEHLVIVPSEYSVTWLVNGHAYKLNTLESVDLSIDIETKDSFFIGQEDVGATPRNNRKFSGSMNLQAGEVMDILNKESLNDATQIKGATLAIIGTNTDNFNFKRIVTGQNINSEKLSLRSTDKETIIPLTFTGKGVTNS
jgi:hypothetical protein